MHLIFHHVAELEHVDDSYRSGLIETFTCSSVVEIGFSECRYFCLVCPYGEVVKRSPVEDGCRKFHSQFFTCPSQHSLEDLSEVHTGRYTQRVQNDIYGCTVGKERHILLTYDSGNNTFVPVTSCHLDRKSVV